MCNNKQQTLLFTHTKIHRKLIIDSLGLNVENTLETQQTAFDEEGHEMFHEDGAKWALEVEIESANCELLE